MTSNEIITKFCEVYKTPLELVDGDRRVPNLIVAEAWQWIERNVSDYDSFYQTVRENFIPTNENHFPTLAHLKQYLPDITYSKKFNADEYYKRENKIVQGTEVGLKLLENNLSVKIEPDKNYANASYDGMMEDNISLTADLFLKRYGYKKVTEFLYKQGAEMSDETYNKLKIYNENIEYRRSLEREFYK
jgi:hypothetical protein